MIRVLRGTEAQRVAYGGLEAGRIMLCTDSDKAYIGSAGGDIELTGAGAMDFISLTDTPANYTNKSGRPLKVNAAGNAVMFWDNFSLDDYPASPDAMDDEFEGGGAIDVKWTKINDPAGADALNQTDFGGFLHVGLLELGTDNFDNFVRIYQAPPAGNQTLEFIAKVALSASGYGGEQAEFMTVGVYLGENVNDQYISADLQYNNAWAMYLIARVNGGEDNGAGASGQMLITEQQLVNPTQPIYLKLKKTTNSAYNASNTYQAWFSFNGLIWQQMGQDTKTFTANCNECGIYFRKPKSQVETPKGEAIVDFFRRTD